MLRVRGVGLTVLGFLAAMLATFVLVRVDPASEIPGLTQAAPREIPVGVVGRQPDAGTMRDALNGPADHPLAARVTASKEVAERRLQERSLSAVLFLGSGDEHTLWVASAAGRAEAERVQEVVEELLAPSGQRAKVVDAVPMGERDPHGVGPFRLGVAWALLGVVFAALLSYVFGARSPGRRLVALRFAGLTAGAAVAGAGGALVSDVLVDRFDAPFWPLAALGTLVVVGVGAVTLALIAWFGRLGLGLAVIGTVLGIPGAIGAWPLTPLPTAWPTLLAWLPPGAATWAIRGLAYFDGNGVERVVLMMVGWTGLGLWATLGAATAVEERPSLRSYHPALRRRPVVATLVAFASVLVLVVAPAVPAFTRTDLEPALEVTCQPFRQPRDVEELNRQIETVSDVSGFVGGDVGASTRLVDERLLMVFGDTLRRPDYARRAMVRNSMLVFGGGCAGVLQRRDRAAVIPDRADGVGYWPMSIASVRLRGTDLVGVMVQRVQQYEGDEPLGFRNLGPAIAVFRVDPGRPPVLQRVVDLGPDDPDVSRPTWGAAATVVGDHAYLYGTSRSSPGFGWAVKVARVRLTDATDLKAFRYWDGQRWQKDPDRAATLISQDEGVSQTFSVFRDGDTWYALSKRDDFAGTDLVLWTAPGPTGPFRPGEALAQIPSTDSVLRYMPLAHPELLPKKGTMVVSVSRNTSDLERIPQDPSLYRPEFLRIDLPD